jgi:hypothetical protein
MAEDTPLIETLNLTRVKYTEAVNAIKRSTLPQFLEAFFSITDCDLEAMKEIADELGLKVYRGIRSHVLEIRIGEKSLTMWAPIKEISE